MKLDQYGNCPICKESWDSGDIPKKYREHYSPPYKFSKLIGVEIQGEYDGISEWQCPFCKTIWDRWTEKIIKKGNHNERNQCCD
jgi:hypothetical protein